MTAAPCLPVLGSANSWWALVFQADSSPRSPERNQFSGSPPLLAALQPGPEGTSRLRLLLSSHLTSDICWRRPGLHVMFQCLCPLVPNFRSTTLWLRTAAGAAVGPPAGGEGPEGLQPHSGRGGGGCEGCRQAPELWPPTHGQRARCSGIPILCPATFSGIDIWLV